MIDSHDRPVMRRPYSAAHELMGFRLGAGVGTASMGRPIRRRSVLAPASPPTSDGPADLAWLGRTACVAAGGLTLLALLAGLTSLG